MKNSNEGRRRRFSMAMGASYLGAQILALLNTAAGKTSEAPERKRDRNVRNGIRYPSAHMPSSSRYSPLDSGHKKPHNMTMSFAELKRERKAFKRRRDYFHCLIMNPCVSDVQFEALLH